MTYDLIAIGGSWGGMNALSRVLDGLSDEVDEPIVVVLHRSTDAPEGGLPSILQHHVRRRVADVEDKDPIERNRVYLAPPDYHVLVERGWFSLSVDERVHYARPSIDVLFESAADAYGERVIGVILTGANDDGARGLAAIKAAGGIVVVQDPETSERRRMPDAAIAATHADAVLPLDDIAPFLYELCSEPRASV
jgi:two-component system, chemotaxis family, protein-glutamate methylesterase/glutaminase